MAIAVGERRVLLICFALAVVSMAIKTMLPKTVSEPNPDQLVLDLSQALSRANYIPRRGTGLAFSRTIVTGTREGCSIKIRNATRFGPDNEAIARQRMNENRPIRYVRKGAYLGRYPTIRIEAEWRIQRELARIGIRYAIDPIIAVGAPDGCWPDPGIFAELKYRLP